MQRPLLVMTYFVLLTWSVSVRATTQAIEMMTFKPLTTGTLKPMQPASGAPRHSPIKSNPGVTPREAKSTGMPDALAPYVSKPPSYEKLAKMDFDTLTTTFYSGLPQIHMAVMMKGLEKQYGAREDDEQEDFDWDQDILVWYIMMRKCMDLMKPFSTPPPPKEVAKMDLYALAKAFLFALNRTRLAMIMKELIPTTEEAEKQLRERKKISGVQANSKSDGLEWKQEIMTWCRVMRTYVGQMKSHASTATGDAHDMWNIVTIEAVKIILRIVTDPSVKSTDASLQLGYGDRATRSWLTMLLAPSPPSKVKKA